MNFKIATYNIWNKNYYFDERYRLIVDELRRADADFVLLQEVRHDDQGNVAEMLAADLGYKYWYFFPDKPEKSISSGLAILSKCKTVKQHRLDLSRNELDVEDKGRKLLAAIEVDLEGRSLLLATTWLAISTQAQLRTTAEIAAFLERIGRPDQTVVVAGDMNNYHQESIAPLLSWGEGMTDALNFVYGLRVPDTWPTSSRAFIESWQAKHPGQEIAFEIVPRRTDYLLLANHSPGRFVWADVFGSPQDESVPASDHLGIEAIVSLP